MLLTDCDLDAVNTPRPVPSPAGGTPQVTWLWVSGWPCRRFTSIRRNEQRCLRFCFDCFCGVSRRQQHHQTCAVREGGREGGLAADKGGLGRAGLPAVAGLRGVSGTPRGRGSCKHRRLARHQRTLPPRPSPATRPPNTTGPPGRPPAIPAPTCGHCHVGTATAARDRGARGSTTPPDATQ